MAATRRRRLLLALVCSVADAEIKGINYGGRFIPEHWLGLPHMRGGAQVKRLDDVIFPSCYVLYEKDKGAI